MMKLLSTNCTRAIFIMLFTFLSVFAQQPCQELTFNADGKFKIVQFTDIHLDNASSINNKLLTMMCDILDVEQPDLVVLTGDIVTSKPAKKGWHSIVSIFIDRQIPWAVTLGNHDDEHDLQRSEIISFLKRLPYSLVQAGPTELGASGNYIIEIKDFSSRENAALVYCIDSNAYTPIEGVGSYGWINFEQVEWFRKQSAQFTRAHNNQPIPGLAFFHIPVPEYNDVWESSDSTCIGSKNESVCAPAINTGMFAAMRESASIMGVFVGHDHDNDYAGCLFDICLAYGRVAGFDTYGDLPRGARVIELLQGERGFYSWIRTEKGDIVNSIHFPTSFKK